MSVVRIFSEAQDSGRTRAPRRKAGSLLLSGHTREPPFGLRCAQACIDRVVTVEVPGDRLGGVPILEPPAPPIQLG